MALYHFSVKVLSRSSRNTVRALAYRAGCKLYDERTGQTFNYQTKDVQHVELVLPKEAPEWAREIQDLMKNDRQKGIQTFVNIVEAAEKRIDAQVYREFEFALHRELTDEQNITLAREFVADQVCSHGMAAQLNFHFDKDPETEEEKPHCHVVATMRRLEESGLSLKKAREWNQKEFLQELRVHWQDYSNFHLKLHGHDIQIDHRCHKERGIELEPQPKLGRGVREQEKRFQKLEGGERNSPITDKARIFHDVQLRNLYRIMRNPEVVFDIVTKHYATFMWADVQKVLHRYVDELPLFQRLEAKLKNSTELVTLRPEGPELEDKVIYTTHSMLKTEKSLIETAEALSQSRSHPVEQAQIDHVLLKANQSLSDKGGLSEDQIKAIHHLIDEGQLKCMVGIAGAGKTTAIGVCHDIWKAEGYSVYGLSPTGKAAQNLEHTGIRSTTVHKFLKSFEGGRCQYNDQSVLVLDEAGMVDVERFQRLLGVVKELGVKLVVVGDGAQLQPVEAGPAFRLVTERIGKAELTTVIRQQQDWQKEATLLFGQQKTTDALQLYMDKGQVHFIAEIGKDRDLRQNTKDALVQAWHDNFKSSPHKNFLILAHTNQDVKDLNVKVRSLLKDSGQISSKEFTFMIKKEEDTDFGKKIIKQEEKGFSQGDRIVFTRNSNSLGVKNGSMGTIFDLNKQTLKVKLDDGKDLSFAPVLNPYFDHGWALTIHKSQGTTVDRAYVLASSSMTQNLTYVAMSRHREDVRVFGSSREFSNELQFSQRLSKSGDKLSAADYLDSESLNKLMQQEDKILTKIFTRFSNELEAMGAVTNRAFWQVADHFLGTQKEQDIRIPQQSIREEVRAQDLLPQKGTQTTLSSPQEKASSALEAVIEDMKHPAFAHATVVKRAFEKGLKVYGEEQAITYWESKKEAYLHLYQQNLAKVDAELKSPLLNNLSDKWKDQTREFAKEDPTKVLELIQKIQHHEGGRRQKVETEHKAAQELRAKQDHIQGIYTQYKQMQETLKENPAARPAFKDYIEKLAKELAQDKTFMDTLKITNSKDAKHIEQVTQEKSLQEKTRALSIDRGRGGLSL